MSTPFIQIPGKKQQVRAPAKSHVTKSVKLLMWAHYVYLLLLPALAVIAAEKLGLGISFAQTILIVGLGPVFMYSLFVAYGYTLPNSLPVALIVTLAVPLQIGLSVLLFGGRSGWLFLAEDATVEIGAFAVGTMSSALPHVGRKQGWKAAAFLIVVAGTIFVGGTIPYFLLVWRGYGGFSLWLILFASSFFTALVHYEKLYSNAIKANQQTGEFQELELRYDGGFIARFFGLDDRVAVTAPFRGRNKKEEIRWRAVILGLLSFLLPFAALAVLEITKE